jgi:hypothetical protein
MSYRANNMRERDYSQWFSGKEKGKGDLLGHAWGARPGRDRAGRALHRLRDILQQDVIRHGESCTRVFPVLRTVSRFPRPENEGAKSLQS